MKTRTKFLVGFSFVILATCLVFFLMIYQPGAGTYVRADKLQDPPENYTEFSLTDLEKYPYVKEAVMNPGKEVKVPFDQTGNLSEFEKITSKNETIYIKVNNEYYWIRPSSAD